MQATQNLPQVVPFEQSHIETITQTELALLVSLRRRLKQLEEEIAAAECGIRWQLENGAAVESGLLHALLKTFERRSVAWKQVCERELGEAYTQLIVEA
jgi:hypothetical protein